MRHLLNPAFQPETRYYIGIPVLGFGEVSYHNNAFSLKDANDKDVNDFYASLLPLNRINALARTNLFSAGTAIHNTYFSLNISQRAAANINAPKDLFNLLIYGTPDRYDNTFNLNKTAFSGILYTETSFGVSQQFNEQWTLGLKLKLLGGNANISFIAENLNITCAVDKWNLQGNAHFGYAGAANLQTDNILNQGTVKYPASPAEWLKWHSAGAGIDFGVHFRMLQNFYISASVTDFGYIRWNKNIVNNRLTADYTFDGLVKLNSEMTEDELNTAVNNFSAVNLVLDSLINDMKSSVQTQIPGAYTTYTHTNLNFAAEYRFLSDRLTAGLLYNAVFYPSNVANRLIVILNFKPFDNLNTTLSYSFMDGYNSLGAGLSFKLGIVNFFSHLDVIPCNYVRIKSSDGSFPFPYTQKNFNFSAGFNFTFGERKKVSEYITTKPYNLRTGLYKLKFKKTKFLWEN